MKLPFPENMVIEDSKLNDYLLNVYHLDGNIKAKFLIERKFDANSLKSILVKQAEEEYVKEVKYSKFGTKYIIESDVKSPDNRTFTLRSVWIVYLNEKFIKLVTAYPIKHYGKKI